ncbi:MAG: hypothetical protein ABIU95_04390, partial [Burkholderiales bacterium]
EFVNRLDRVVVFRPLSRTVMREILKKELADVLQRRGFRSREWAVEWEDSAIEFLLERGFTPDMGARPLRRAIEQYVLAPLAMTIVERRHPEGDQFLFVRSDGSAIQVQFVDPDAPATPPTEPEADSAGEPPRELALGRVALAAAGTADEARFLVTRVDTLEARLVGDTWRTNKQSLLERMNVAGFWDEPERFGVIDRIERIDRIEAGATTTRSLADRLAKRRGAASSQVAANLAEQLYLIEAAIMDLDMGRSSDVYLALEPVAGDAQARDTGQWIRRLSSMYQQWAKRRRMRCTVLTSIEPPFVLAIAGLGAHCLLEREAGLHVFETPEENGGYARSTVRVRIALQPVTPKPPQQAELDYASIALVLDASVPAVVRRYRERPSPLVRDAVGGWRTGRLNQVLGGDFDLMQ